MKTSSIIAVLSVAISSVIAVPTGGSSSAPTCSSSQTISCCNTKMTTTNDKGLISALNGISLLDGCTGVSLLELAGLSPQTYCGGNTAACCTGNQATGLIAVNANCNTIPVII
ncbi:hypothetical protein B0A49_11008 [Cryomyces minteri]|uniref:Hydrophobin n=1 Tax=Cryomyces minteri TaxID=331657 RepID=A0A4U0WSX8_9PEZI|nr:hypothetical protein B0A49_11008 [Cryomyces minteri]